MNRQMITYEVLGKLMFQRQASGVLANILDHVASFCNLNKLAPLTAIVVNKESGRPGKSIPIELATLDQQRERVYRQDWYDICPPTEQELSDAFLAKRTSS
jgi:hypothetical protein